MRRREERTPRVAGPWTGSRTRILSLTGGEMLRGARGSGRGEDERRAVRNHVCYSEAREVVYLCSPVPVRGRTPLAVTWSLTRSRCVRGAANQTRASPFRAGRASPPRLSPPPPVSLAPGPARTVRHMQAKQQLPAKAARSVSGLRRRGRLGPRGQAARGGWCARGLSCEPLRRASARPCRYNWSLAIWGLWVRARVRAGAVESGSVRYLAYVVKDHLLARHHCKTSRAIRRSRARSTDPAA